MQQTDPQIKSRRDYRRLWFTAFELGGAFWYNAGGQTSRSSRRRILPTGVIGRDSRISKCLGTL